jgi:hypothetical protein
MSNAEKIEKIAKIVHQANKAFCESLGDNSQVEWELAPENIKASARDGVRNVLRNPDMTPEDNHINWLQFKIDDGWKYGPVKDAEKKTHPCMLPYDALEEDDKIKDKLFGAIVKTFI